MTILREPREDLKKMSNVLFTYHKNLTDITSLLKEIVNDLREDPKVDMSKIADELEEAYQLIEEA